MKKHLASLSRLALWFVPVVSLTAQTEHITAFTGTWKLNKAKTTTPAAMTPQGITEQFTPEGRFIGLVVDQAGNEHKSSFPWSDGKEVPVEGMENNTAIQTIRGRTLDMVFKHAGKTVVGQFEILFSGRLFLSKLFEICCNDMEPLSPPKHAPGTPIRFTNPTTGEKAEGRLVDEVCVEGEIGPVHDGWRQAAFYAQLVDWGDKLRIRFCYYVRKKDKPTKWRFSRFAPSMRMEDCKELLEKIHQADWSD